MLRQARAINDESHAQNASVWVRKLYDALIRQQFDPEYARYKVHKDCNPIGWVEDTINRHLPLETRIYQDFCDRNLKLNKREHELSISELEVKKMEQQKAITELQDHASILHESNEISDLDPEIIHTEEVISIIDVLIPSPDMTNNYHQNENEMIHYPLQVEPSLPRALIFDTKDLT